MEWTRRSNEWRVPVKCWASQIEQSAIDQLGSLAKMPCVFHHVAIMPDGHSGYANPIGSVVAYEGAIAPYGIGSDAGCVDCDTEILTPNGWIRIADYNGEEILEYNPEDDTGHFSLPERYIVKPCEEFFHFKHSNSLDQMVCEEHRLLVYTGYAEQRPFRVMTPLELLKMKSLVKGYYSFNTCFSVNGQKGCGLTEQLIRVDIMVQADGRIAKKHDTYNFIQLHFRKTSKIERARLLLDEADIKYNEYKAKDGSTYISFHVPKSINKTLDKYWNGTFDELKVVCDECLYWDGVTGYRPAYSSTNKKCTDVIQFAFLATNNRASIFKYTDKRNRNGWNDVYNVIKTRNKYVGYYTPTKVKSKDGKKYCFTTNTGFFLARRNGYPFLTGNCGMHTFRTNIPVKELESMSLRREIQNEIKKLVPVGQSIHSKEQDWVGFDNYENADGLDFLMNDRVRKSLGTIGSGNHFLSLEKSVWVDDGVKGGEYGDEGFVWGLIHTGSRNLGKQLADYYHNLAVENCRRWHSDIPSDEYAFLPVDTDLGRQYIRDMEYALEYALENRRRICRAMQVVLGKYFPGFELDFEYDIHHNYARLEHHFGKDVWVHRKGATSARLGEVGIIPGSMGTASYIVEGLGNEESFCSCSHGAGRKMSRSKATDTLTVKECDDAMDGIVCERWSKIRFGAGKGKVDLSEAPQAYKDIEQVIADEKDLVKPLVRLMPLCNLKG